MNENAIKNALKNLKLTPRNPQDETCGLRRFFEILGAIAKSSQQEIKGKGVDNETTKSKPTRY